MRISDTRLELAKYWLYQCAPETANKAARLERLGFYNTLTDDEKKEIALLYDFIKAGDSTLDSLNTKLYDIPKEVYGADIENLKKIQGQFFKIVYKLLISKERGPRTLPVPLCDRQRKIHASARLQLPYTEEEEALEKAALEASVGTGEGRKGLWRTG